MLVGVKSWANVRALKAVLLLFESISSLKVNFNKSMIFGLNVNDSLLHEATSVMRCKHGHLPFLYLGLPIGGDPQKLQFWYPLVNRIHNRLSGWKCKNFMATFVNMFISFAVLEVLQKNLRTLSPLFGS